MSAAVAGIDVGTSRIKLDVYRGNELVERRSWANEFLRDGGVVEQDPELVRARVLEALDVARRLGARCIGLSTYRGSIVVWRAGGGKAANVVTWMDRRSLELYKTLPLRARVASRLPVLGSTLSPESPMVKLRILLEERRDLYEGLASGRYRAWNIDAYLVEALTGGYKSDPSNKALMGIVHPRDLKPIWLVARLLGLPRIPIPNTLYHDEVVEAGDFALGVVMGDQQATNHGTGCVEPGCIRIGMGSGLFASLVTGPRLELSPGKGLVPLIIYRDRASSIYGLEGYITGLGRAVEWFIDNFFRGDYDILNEVSREPGRPPVVLPFFWGLRYPRRTRGLAGVLGIEPHHTLRDVAKGVAHSIAASIAFQVRLLSPASPGRVRVVVTGGLSRLRGLVSLTASYLGRSVERTVDPDTAALGVARIAARNCGVDGPSPAETEVIDPAEGVEVIEPERLFEWIGSLESVNL